MAKKDGNRIEAIGIKNLKLWSNVKEITIQYKLAKKYPKPKHQPYLKNALSFFNSFLCLNTKIQNKEKVKKLIKKKLYGGKLYALNEPKKIVYKRLRKFFLNKIDNLVFDKRIYLLFFFKHFFKIFWFYVVMT